VFFEPENQAIETVRTEISDMAAKIKAAAFEPKKGSIGLLILGGFLFVVIALLS
jgi:hypothetical protein